MDQEIPGSNPGKIDCVISNLSSILSLIVEQLQKEWMSKIPTDYKGAYK